MTIPFVSATFAPTLCVMCSMKKMLERLVEQDISYKTTYPALAKEMPFVGYKDVTEAVQTSHDSIFGQFFLGSGIYFQNIF